METLNFREAEIEDLPQIVDLVNIAYRSTELKGWTSEADLVEGNRTDHQQVKQLIQDNSKLFVMFKAEKLIGCVHIHQKNASCYIGMLTTHPTVQNRHIGKTILELAEQYAIKNYAASIFEMSVLSIRKDLIGFYERRGYKLTGESEPYPVDANVGIPLVADIQVLHLRKELC